MGFITYIGIRLAKVAKFQDPDFNYYEFAADKHPESYVLENDSLKFELDPKTTQFTVLQKSTGHVWYSNNPKTQNDPVALPKEKNNMMSTLLIKYSTENGVEETYDVYTNSVKRKFYDVSKKDNKVTVQYTVGQMDREYIFPLVMYDDEMEEWFEKMSKSDANKITSYYHKYVYDEVKPDLREDLAAKYEHFKSKDLYLVFDNLKAFQKEKSEQVFAKAGYTMEDYNRSKEMYKETSVKDVPSFNVTVIYSLDKNGLVVEVPFDEISYKTKYPITKISTLPFFGCAGTDDNGFMLVPEGGGSIINFNNNKIKQSSYYIDCYGWDYASDRKSVITETRTAFPVFGVAYEDSSFISIMEEGDTYGGVTAEISGKLSSFNYIRADYKLLHREQFEVSTRTSSPQYSYEKHLPYGEKIKQVYKFVDSGSYVDMAKAYREYLFANEKKLSNKNVPVSVEIVGAIDKIQQIFGIPKTMPYQLTSYKQAAQIIEQLDGLGLKDANVKLLGFVNEGMSPLIFNKMRMIKQLGSKKEFCNLTDVAKKASVNLYLDGMMQFAYRSGFFDGVQRFITPARFASSEVCELSEYSLIWYGKDPERDNYYLLNPGEIDKNTDVFIKNALKNDFTGISFRDNGYILSADYNDNRPVSREAAKNQQMLKFKEAKEKGLSIMTNAGNAYSVKDVDFITNMDLSGNSYAILDRSVPFYQIALHGYKNYTSVGYNLAYDKKQILLESAESGAGLNFTVMSEPETKIQDTHYTQYFCANFDSNKDDISRIYNEYNNKMKNVMNSCITDHEYLNNFITVTTYENNYKVYVNYGYTDFVTESGITIPARDYIVQEEK